LLAASEQFLPWHRRTGASRA